MINLKSDGSIDQTLVERWFYYFIGVCSMHFYFFCFGRFLTQIDWNHSNLDTIKFVCGDWNDVEFILNQIFFLSTVWLSWIKQWFVFFFIGRFSFSCLNRVHCTSRLFCKNQIPLEDEINFFFLSLFAFNIYSVKRAKRAKQSKANKTNMRSLFPVSMVFGSLNWWMTTDKLKRNLFKQL